MEEFSEEIAAYYLESKEIQCITGGYIYGDEIPWILEVLYRGHC